MTHFEFIAQKIIWSANETRRLFMIRVVKLKIDCIRRKGSYVAWT